ncbi:aminoglycoside phosphotransferase family protein [Aspergillus homomorphus CBS 101889]|uniref:Kinase-like protein n=1 Tax=Aspergillus homomorphus (strain CBS 101889) TaxID=1450537 RepID=A0A395I864_ASPHC|nr:kinase-like protein [Aspergillus homomorphus CBS 101889]RAL16156.1 kinase-like protein [Aspergillus homomorphus CBS 101889]
MAIPWNIRGSASQILFREKRSSQYQALLALADVPHPDRSLLGGFVNDASNPEKSSEILPSYDLHGGWLRPTLATSLSSEAKTLVFERDAGRCCLTRTLFKSPLDRDLVFVHIISPYVLSDPDLSEETALYEMLSSFLSEELMEAIRKAQGEQPEKLDNICLLSKQAFHALKTGDVFLTSQSWSNSPDKKQQQTVIHLESGTPQLAPIVSEDLIHVHAYFSKSLAWIETKMRMNTSHEYNAPRHESELWHNFFLPSLISPFSLFRRFWPVIPPSVRSCIYDTLICIGSRIYEPALSMTVFRLPFSLYLRRGPTSLGSKYHAEVHTLNMVEQSTSIPAPRAIDVLETPRSSYLLMTRVPGRPIGHFLNTMTDEQIKQAVDDLKTFIAELRRIPRPATEYQICNSQGGGFLDWRIPDSQRGELRFESEADFNRYLTEPSGEKVRADAAKSHNIRHDIVFTHGDLNPRNILAEGGRITGIVDWENAGWFPEYWEYSKMHYTVRHVMHWLVDVVDIVFEGYRDELHVENMLSDLLGPF